MLRTYTFGCGISMSCGNQRSKSLHPSSRSIELRGSWLAVCCGWPTGRKSHTQLAMRLIVEARFHDHYQRTKYKAAQRIDELGNVSRHDIVLISAVRRICAEETIYGVSRYLFAEA